MSYGYEGGTENHSCLAVCFSESMTPRRAVPVSKTAPQNDSAISSSTKDGFLGARSFGRYLHLKPKLLGQALVLPHDALRLPPQAAVSLDLRLAPNILNHAL